MLGVRKWIGKGGAFTIELERIGGRHADTAPAIALAVDKAGGGARVAGQGFLDWIAEEARIAQGLPPRRSSRALAPAVVEAPALALVPLPVPPKFAGSSHITSMRGTIYVVQDGTIFVEPEDVEDMLKLFNRSLCFNA